MVEVESILVIYTTSITPFTPIINGETSKTRIHFSAKRGNDMNIIQARLFSKGKVILRVVITLLVNDNVKHFCALVVMIIMIYQLDLAKISFNCN